MKGRKLMNAETQLILNYLKHEYEVETCIKMYHEEINLGLFPEKILKKLPDPLLLLTASYVDEEDQEWIFCIATEVNFPTKFLRAQCLKEGRTD